MRTIAIALAATLIGISPAAADLLPAPQTPKQPVVDYYQGVKVTDDYRWLEDSNSPAVKQWSDAQNVRTREYLDNLPHRAQVSSRVDRLIRSSSISYYVALERAGRLYAYKSDPKLQQRMIVTLASADDLGSERIIVDPNALDAKGGIEIDWFTVSLDGSKIGVSLSKGGSESGDLHLYDVATAKEVAEVIPGVQKGTAGGSAAFTPDGLGFWYTRYPRGSEHSPEDSGFFQQVWFHRIGTPTEADTYELGKELPKIAEIALETKEDGKWVVAEVKNGDGGEAAYYLRSTSAGSPWVQLSAFSDKIVQYAFGRDDAIYLMSRMGSPKGRLLRLPLDAPPSLKGAVEIVKESEGSISAFVPTASRIYVNDLLGGPSRVRVFDLAGKRLADLPIPRVSAVDGMVAAEGDDILLEDGGYLELPAWLEFSAASGALRRTALVRTSLADFSDTEVIREFAKSKDGTMVPLDIIRRKSAKLDGSNPTILYGYGGFGVSLTPRFSASRRIWLDQGGVYVMAILRGGGEFGDEWHLAGNLTKKQNVFDDFYACAVWLVEHKYTTNAKLAIFGASNGGLLMGAALTQHPEFYRAVVSRVGIYDGLRSELTTNGRFNVTEFGTVTDPDQFKAIYAYSPYHHVVDGVKYPSILLTTGANDPRVDPWHSRKFCARLQAADPSGNPILLRTSKSAGHGMGSSLNETIAEQTDIFGFLIHELGVDFKPVD
jgi:prolyl oligopeptidase